MTPAILEHSSVILMAHDPSVCAGQPCCLHGRTNHAMRSWPQLWRADRHLMERVCVHGVGHPDPDDPKASDPVESVHGCCGCCRGEQ